MNANELANCLEEILKGTAIGKDCTAMLRKQAKEIKELKEDLKNRNINIEYLKEKLIASIDDIKTLKAELEDCTCQGGHSEAYLKIKER